MVKITHCGTLFDDIANNFAACHDCRVDFLLLRVIGADGGYENPWANVALQDKRFLRSSASYTNVAVANMTCYVVDNRNWEVEAATDLALKTEGIFASLVVGEYGFDREYP